MFRALFRTMHHQNLENIIFPTIFSNLMGKNIFGGKVIFYNVISVDSA